MFGVEFAFNASKVKLNNAKILLFDKVKFKTLISVLLEIGLSYPSLKS